MFSPAGFLSVVAWVSERFEFATDYSLGDISDVLEPVIDDPFNFTLYFLHFYTTHRQDLHTCHKRAVDGLSNLGEEADIQLFDPFHFRYAIGSYLCREQVIDLADMVYRVFPLVASMLIGRLGVMSPLQRFPRPTEPSSPISAEVPVTVR